MSANKWKIPFTNLYLLNSQNTQIILRKNMNNSKEKIMRRGNLKTRIVGLYLQGKERKTEKKQQNEKIIPFIRK